MPINKYNKDCLGIILLVQVLINILNNTRDVCDERRIKNPMVSLSVKHDANNAYIQINDNGGGADESIIQKIFDPYFTTKHQAQGTGLGLYMSKRIIEEHLKGIITAKNVGGGMEFFISLPLVEREREGGRQTHALDPVSAIDKII